MCGIVGYIGARQAAPILLDGLKKLEYRGYDSAGVAVLNEGAITVKKTKGRLKNLSDMIDGGHKIPGTIGIGHTRWATHGEPSDINSHPHTSESGKIAVVHNGIIENYMKIKEFLTAKGYTFVSETDTEVIAHLADYYYNGNLLETVVKIINKLEGSYALGLISSDHPDQMIAVRKDSPLIIGLGEAENFIASDIPAILKYTRSVYLIEDNEIALLTPNGVTLYNTDLDEISKEVFSVDWDIAAAEKGGYEHFMFKEIMEEPQSVLNTIGPVLRDGLLKLDKVPGRISIVACGSAYHVGIVGKYVIEALTRIPVEVDIASEYRYRNPIITEDTLVVVISQSGETADTIAALREAKKQGAKIFGIVNVVGSSIARESDEVLYTLAGPEIAVATTKAYSTQLTAVYLLALSLKKAMGELSAEEEKYYAEELLRLPDLISAMIEQKDKIQYYASRYFNAKSVFFIGRGLDYALSLEGSLKLKEISYIHSEAYGAGELKHGTISLIEEGTLVIAVATQEKLFEKIVSNIREVKARGAVVLAIATEGCELIEECADGVLYIPKTDPLFTSSPAVTLLQLFAYYVASLKGCDIDKPRNLAKSVTVE
ncbi:MAG: glutamine--fructose-6-phosphate transaminase (isomerizing) [Ruminococcaceae bacterium]|nr:glutamine--fructose-6-phosphate transaminase (isomerizing) [Oscillospiraceae bacterium]